MPSSSRCIRFVPPLILSIGVLTACAAAIRVHSYAERGAVLSQYRTYDFGPAEAQSTGDPRLDSNPFFYGRIHTAVERQLAAKGYEKPASATPDLLVHVHASVTQDINVDETDRRYGYCPPGQAGWSATSESAAHRRRREWSEKA